MIMFLLQSKLYFDKSEQVSEFALFFFLSKIGYISIGHNLTSIRGGFQATDTGHKRMK